MSERFTNEYVPEVASYPGETLTEVLEDRAMTQAELAERMGRPKKTINEIANGKAEITPETALQLERVLGIPASFWSNLERNYRDSLAMADERQALRGSVSWARRFPLKQMVDFRWIAAADDDVARVRTLLTFFSVSSMTQWENRYQGQLAAFRLAKKYPPDPYALTAWLRMGEIRGQQTLCAPFDAAAFRSALNEARALTREHDPQVFQPRLTELAASCGVAVAFVRELRHSRACGATRWLAPDKALIQLSLRYKSNDQLWFTFFHEAGHILLHGKRDAFIEIWAGSSGLPAQEEEADRFAAERLIPKLAYDALARQRPISRAAVVAFAEGVGIDPGVVVGRLQHEEVIPFKYLNDLKVRYEWSND